MKIETRSDKPDTGNLRSLRSISWLFDELVRVPWHGTFKFGLDAVLGLLPGGGDVLGGAVSVYALFAARRLGAPTSVIIRMALKIVIDAVLGAVPFLGDIFDVAWKANRKTFRCSSSSWQRRRRRRAAAPSRLCSPRRS